MRFGSTSLIFIHIIVMASVIYGAEPTGSIRGEVMSRRTPNSWPFSPGDEAEREVPEPRDE